MFSFSFQMFTWRMLRLGGWMATTHNGDKDRHFNIFTKSCTWSRCLLVHGQRVGCWSFIRCSTVCYHMKWTCKDSWMRVCKVDNHNMMKATCYMNFIPCIYSRALIISIGRLVFIGLSNTIVYTHHWICLPPLRCMAPIITTKKEFKCVDICSSSHRPPNAQWYPIPLCKLPKQKWLVWTSFLLMTQDPQRPRSVQTLHS